MKIAGSEPAFTCFPVALKYILHFGGFIFSFASSSAAVRASCAGCIKGLWNAPPVFIALACRAFWARASLQSCSMHSLLPEQVKPDGNKKLETWHALGSFLATFKASA